MRRHGGNRLIWSATVVNLAAWVLLPPGNDGRPDYLRQVIAEMIATTTVLLFAAALLLSTRARWLEPHFGGLDKAYRAHRQASTTGFLLLVAHVALIPWRLDSPGGVPAGLIAFVGITILVILAIGPRLAITQRLITLTYRSWRRTHWLIGFFFIFSLAHMLLVDSLVTTTTVPFLIVMVAYVIGVASFLYVILLARFVRRRRKYVVAEANRLNSTTLEVVLNPRKKPIEYTSGQFVFVRFKRATPARTPPIHSRVEPQRTRPAARHQSLRRLHRTPARPPPARASGQSRRGIRHARLHNRPA